MVMGARKIEGDVAVVGPGREPARAAAARLRASFPRACLLPMTLSEYLRRAAGPVPVVLAVAGADAARDRIFLERARDRILWPAPAPDLYDAICGVLTSLPARPRARFPGTAEDAAGLLLEGTVGPDRARAALASPLRQWVVEHPGRVHVPENELGRLREEGVRWAALSPVWLLGVADPAGASRGLFPAGTRIWRRAASVEPPDRPDVKGRRGSRAPSRRSSRR